MLQIKITFLVRNEHILLFILNQLICNVPIYIYTYIYIMYTYDRLSVFGGYKWVLSTYTCIV
jgi:hypothetical protein